MESVHNPDRYMADLRQILSQGRKRIGLLIGAGAPLSVRIDQKGKLSSGGRPLIPGVDALTNRVIEALEGQDRIAADAMRAVMPSGGNIEKILSRVRLLQEALGETPVTGLDGAGYKQLGARICNVIGEIVGAKLPKDRCAYHELIGWISGTARPHPIEIFTTNYDLLLEEAFESAKTPYFDGFTGGHAPFFDPVTVAGNDLPPRWTRLWKLHGSLGWRIENGMVVRSGGHECSELVYPDHLKYDLTQKQPYTALFERLKTFLLQPDTLLLAAGFSFRDAHICALLDDALAMNANAAVFAFQFQSLGEEQAACAMAFDRPNLSIYAADGAVINGVAGKWRPGDPPKNWTEIRASFWGPRPGLDESLFLLGDFVAFCRFCALSHSSDLVRPVASEDEAVAVEE
jgi:hypothetical protein